MTQRYLTGIPTNRAAGVQNQRVVHCCEEMRQEVERVCGQHPDQFECPDSLIHYGTVYREYGLIVHDGGTSVISIRFCPWCGTRLPESLRDRWFEQMERLGIDPGTDAVPAEFLSSAWWAGGLG